MAARASVNLDIDHQIKYAPIPQINFCETIINEARSNERKDTTCP
jgi:hypothetical protein